MLSQRSHLQKTIYARIPSRWNVGNRQIHGDTKISGWLGLGENEGRLLTSSFFLRWWTFSKIDCSNSCTTVNILTHWIICFKCVNSVIWDLYLNQVIKKPMTTLQSEVWFCHLISPSPCSTVRSRDLSTKYSLCFGYPRIHFPFPSSTLTSIWGTASPHRTL